MKTYTVNCIEKDTLKIGSYNDTIWNKAVVLTDFTSPWEDVEIDKIEFRALWDLDTIYFSFKVYDNQIHIDKKDNTKANIANSDRVEIFLRSDASLNPYYCLEIDPTPRIMDFIAIPNKVFDYNWNWPEKDLEVKSIRNKDYFVVEIAITIVSLEAFNLIKNNKIEAGIFRAKYTQKENLEFEPTWITWVNPETETPNFHIASSFGILNLALPQK
jgi:hypothetical protein